MALCLVFLLPAAAAADPPANDSFQSASVVGTLPFTDELDITGATPDLVDVSTCLLTKSVWYDLHLDAGEKVFINTEGSNFTTNVAIFQPGPAPTGGSCGNTPERFYSAAVTGTHRIRIGTDATEGSQTLKLAIYEPGLVSGRVVDDLGAPIEGVEVMLEDVEDWFGWNFVYTDEDGIYSIPNLSRGIYRLSFWSHEHLFRYYHNADAWADQDEVQVTGGPVVLADQVLLRQAAITGTLTLDDGSVANGCVTAYHQDGRLENWGYSEGGVFGLGYLPPGSYDLLVTDSCSSAPLGTLKDEWYQDASGPGTATPINVATGEIVSGIAITVSSADVPSNDSISNATDLGALPTEIKQGLSRATTDPADPLVCGITGKTVWYKYTASEDELMYVDSWQNRSVVAVHRVEADGQLSHVGCTRNFYFDSSTTFSLEQGTTYMLELGATGGAALAGISLSLFDSEGGGRFTFTPRNPCHVQCPYWNQQRTREQKNEDACAPDPDAPEGSWEDLRIDVPTTLGNKVPASLTFSMDPKNDHDVWFCRVEPEDGKYLVTYAANSATEVCDNMLPLGCEERFTAPVQPGKSYVIRVYNWSDVDPVEGQWWYRTVAQKTGTPTG